MHGWSLAKRFQGVGYHAGIARVVRIQTVHMLFRPSTTAWVGRVSPHSDAPGPTGRRGTGETGQRARGELQPGGITAFSPAEQARWRMADGSHVVPVKGFRDFVAFSERKGPTWRLRKDEMDWMDPQELLIVFERLLVSRRQLKT